MPGFKQALGITGILPQGAWEFHSTFGFAAIMMLISSNVFKSIIKWYSCFYIIFLLVFLVSTFSELLFFLDASVFIFYLARGMLHKT